MIIEMILSITDRVLERSFLIGGGATGGVVAWVKMEIPRILLLMTWHELVDLLITVSIGAGVGWGIHQLLNWIRRLIKKKIKRK